MVSREIFNDWKGAFPFLKEYTYRSDLNLRLKVKYHSFCKFYKAISFMVTPPHEIKDFKIS